MIAQKFLDMYNSFLIIYNNLYSSQTAYKLFLLKKQLDEHYDFLISREQQLLSQYNGKIEDNGKLNFVTQEEQQKFIDAHKELSNIEINLPEIKIDMNLSEVTNNISPFDIELLSNIINFSLIISLNALKLF